MIDNIKDFRKTAIKCGVPINEVDNISLDELQLLVECKEEELKDRLKEQAVQDYQLATLILTGINGDKNTKFPTLYKHYRYLFEEEYQQEQITQFKNSLLRVSKTSQ